MKVRSFGSCYVCGKAVYGYVLRDARPYATSRHTRLAWRDEKGVRHSTCDPWADLKPWERPPVVVIDATITT